jgi:tetratricopeptide (TPR) repeat protein
MFTALSPRFKNIILFAAVLLGISLSSLAQADVQACFNFLNAQDYARAEYEAKQILQRGNLTRTDAGYAQLCLGRAYSSMGRWQDALPAFQRVEDLSQNTEELMHAYNGLGLSYSNLNDLGRADFYDQRYLNAARKLGDKTEVAAAQNNLASVANKSGDTERALNLYLELLTMLPKAKQANTLNNIATIHADRKEYPQAIGLLRQAIEIDRSNGDTHQTAIYQINLGQILTDDKQYEPAEKELRSGLNAIRLVGDKDWEAEACSNLGALAKNQNKFSIARDWYVTAAGIYRELGDGVRANGIAEKISALGKSK